MPVAQGDKIPAVEVRTMGAEGPQTVNTGDVLGHGKIALFAVPSVHARVLQRFARPGTCRVPTSYSRKA